MIDIISNYPSIGIKIIKDLNLSEEEKEKLKKIIDFFKKENFTNYKIYEFQNYKPLEDEDNKIENESIEYKYTSIGICIDDIFFARAISAVLLKNGYVVQNIYNCDDENIFTTDVLILDEKYKERFSEFDNVIFFKDENVSIVEQVNGMSEIFFNEYSDSFYSHLFHKFKNPMSTLHGYVQLLSTKINKDEKIFNYYEKIKSQVDIMNSLIKRTSDFVLMNPPKITYINSEALCRAFKDNVSEIYGESIKLETSCDNSFKIKADLSLFVKAVLNIIDNYYIYHDCDEKKIIIEFEKKDNNSFNMKIKGEDMKLPQNFIDDVFKPYFSTKKGKYFGLGLNESRKIFKRFKGYLNIIQDEESSVFNVNFSQKIIDIDN